MKSLCFLTMLFAVIGIILIGCEKSPNPVEAPLSEQGGLHNLGKAGLVITSGTQNYGDKNLSGGYQIGHFDDVWDLTAGDMTISFTYDGNGLVDNAGAHAWAELGVRSLSSGTNTDPNQPADFNPYYRWEYTYPQQTVDLLAGQHTDVGDIIVWGDGTNLYVKYIVSNGGCVITESHLAIATSLDDFPQTKNGNPIPNQFPYKMVHNPPVAEYTYTIDATQWNADTKLYIAAHAVVVCGGTEETAWAKGVAFFGKNWATYFTYTPVLVRLSGSGVWLATDYDWAANTFDPDVSPTLDLDDKLILQRRGGYGESDYNLPSAPSAPGNNHRVWWDRDGVDPWQNDETANTEGIYQIVISLHAVDATNGKAYMKIRNLDQGFEVDGNWNTIELTPAGMTFVGDMEHLQVFYGIYGYGATHSVSFNDITVTQ